MSKEIDELEARIYNGFSAGMKRSDAEDALDDLVALCKAAENDYKDMRRFQAEFMRVDHELRELKAAQTNMPSIDQTIETIWDCQSKHGMRWGVYFYDWLRDNTSQTPNSVAEREWPSDEKIYEMATQWIQDQEFVDPCERIHLTYDEGIDAFAAGFKAAKERGQK